MNIQNRKNWQQRGVLGRHISVFLFVCLLPVLFLLPGCTVGPDFVPIQSDLPDSWSGSLPQSRSSGADEDVVRLEHWWRIFDDPALNALEKRAVAANLDLQLAEARIRQARAAARITAGNLGPSIDATSTFQRSYSMDTSTDSIYQFGFDALWERDLFGGQKRNLEAAAADVLTAEELRNDVLVSLTAEVARNYIQLRTYQRQLVICRNNVVAQQHILGLVRERLDSGFASALEMEQAQLQEAKIRGLVPQLETSVQQAIHSISILLDRAPSALLVELAESSAIPAAEPAVPVGIPSDLLRRRPDIRAAEARIHGASARIGVATSDLFPKLILSGSSGFRTDNFGSLLDWSNRYWSWGPSVSWNIFNMGRLKATVDVQKILHEQEVIAYYQTVQKSMQEVEDALVSLEKGLIRNRSLTTANEANRKSCEITSLLYAEGMIDFSSVLEAQQALYTTEDSLAEMAGSLSTSMVILYKALGGGWESKEES